MLNYTDQTWIIGDEQRKGVTELTKTNEDDTNEKPTKDNN